MHNRTAIIKQNSLKDAFYTKQKKTKGWRFFTGELQMKVLILTSGCRRLWDACGVWGHHFDTSFVFSSTAAGLSPCAVFLSIVQYSNQSVYWTTRHFLLFWGNNNLSQLLPPNDLSNWKESVFPTIIQLRLYVFAGEVFSAHIGENCHFFLTRYLLNLPAWLEHQNISHPKKQKSCLGHPSVHSVHAFLLRAMYAHLQGVYKVAMGGRGVGCGREWWRRKQSISVSRVFKPTPWHLWASILPCIIASGNNGLQHTWWPQFYGFEVETVLAKGILIYSPSSFLLKSSRFAELRRSPVLAVTPAPCCSGDMNPLSPSCRNLLCIWIPPMSDRCNDRTWVR